jgi:hydrogenase maturation protein HypF
MLLEAVADRGVADSVALPLNRDDKGIWRTDWAPLLTRLMDESVSQANRARDFHESMANALLQQAITLREIHGDFAVGLAGGVFQNRLLTERVLEVLDQHGFRGYLPQQIPVNDAGLCFGQVVEVSGMFDEKFDKQLDRQENRS